MEYTIAIPAIIAAVVACASLVLGLRKADKRNANMAEQADAQH